jgi:cytosol alanyl aminopeptidase
MDHVKTRILRFAAFASVLAALVGWAEAAETPQPPQLRLGDAATPVSYEASLAIDPKETSFSGTIRIELRFNRAVPVLWLNASALTVEAAEIEQGARKIPVKVIPGGEDFVGFVPEEGSFDAGAAVATIRYRGVVDSVTKRGVYRQIEGGEWYVITQFEAISARFAFPCFDEPGWKTPWRLTIDAPASNVVASNTPETSASVIAAMPGWQRHAFAATKPLPSYLVALAVGPFDVVDGGTAGARKVRLRYFTPKGRASEARYAREVTPRIVALLEAYFGIPYPFEKLDSVSVPQGGGAMENAGMITYNTRFLLARPHEETDANKRSYVSIAAHEIAHHWVGDYVTLAWWDDIWLNEAFATWMAEKVLYQFNPAWDNGSSHSRQRRRALTSDRLASARRVQNPVTAKGDIRAAFDGITYDKGGEVLSMFETSLGPEKFRRGVHAFLESHAYGSATSGEFFAAIAAASGRKDAVKAFAGFIEQPGVPLVDASLKCGAGKAVLAVSQARLRPIGSTAVDEQWETPACFRYSADGKPRTQCVEVSSPKSTDIPIEAKSCPAWLVGNAGGRGHYVVRYDADLAKRTREGFREVPRQEAVALLGDAALLARSGLLSMDEALRWADAAFGNPSPIVRMSAVQLLLALRDEWLTPAQLQEKRYIVLRQAVPLARSVGWIEKSGEGEDVRLLRTVLLPFAADSDAGAALRPEARTLAFQWIENRASVSSNMAGPALDTAARFADEATYARLEAAVMAIQDQRDRRTLLEAIAKVRDPRLRERALGLALMKKEGAEVFNGGQVHDLLSFAAMDDASRAAALHFVSANFDAIAAKIPKDSEAWLIESFAGLCTPAERDAFRAFLAPRAAAFLGGDLAFRQTMESIELCVAARGA